MELQECRGYEGMLRDEEVGGIVRLISRASTVDGGLSERRKFLLEGVSRLVAADAWGWIKSGRNYLGCGQPEGRFRRRAVFEISW